MPQVTKLLCRAGRALVKIGQNAERYDMATNGEAWLLHSLAPFHTAIDIGANHGNWTATALAASPEARVICIEAIPVHRGHSGFC